MPERTNLPVIRYHDAATHTMYIYIYILYFRVRANFLLRL